MCVIQHLIPQRRGIQTVNNQRCTFLNVFFYRKCMKSQIIFQNTQAFYEMPSFFRQSIMRFIKYFSQTYNAYELYTMANAIKAKKKKVLIRLNDRLTQGFPNYLPKAEQYKIYYFVNFFYYQITFYFTYHPNFSIIN